MGFKSLGIAPEYVKVLQAHQIEKPTPIQAQAIPVIRSGADVIAQSLTGTGKTMAYLLPTLEKLDRDSKQLQALVIVPTRELAMQILREAQLLTEHTELVAQALIGGAALNRQIDRLKQNPQLIIGTPGRVLELIKLRKLKVHFVKSIIVDEVDQVFDLGVMHEVEQILKSTLKERQLVFFSATIPDDIRKIADRWMKQPVTIAIDPDKRMPEQVKHMYFLCERRDKIDMVRRVVRLLQPKSTIVFVNQIEAIDELEAKLRYVKLEVGTLFSEMNKQERSVMLQHFRDGKFQVLIATDIAARGLDIKEVSLIINFDLPIDSDHYVHRIGRTGRMGRSGTAISLVTHQEQFIIRKLEKSLAIKISRKQMVRGKLVDVK